MSNRINIPKDMVSGFEHETKFNGRLAVVEYFHSHKVEVKFLATGYKSFARSAEIRNGNVKDPFHPVVFGVGYIGVGKYKTSIGVKHTKTYSTWSGMLERCYSKELQSKYPTYKGCAVCEEWHNFQNFADWMVSQDYHGKQLDKDIKVKGNKVYSPETCLFVTCQENVSESLAKSYRLLSPVGDLVEIKNLSKFCRDKDLSRGSMNCVVTGRMKQHKGWKLAEQLNKQSGV